MRRINAWIVAAIGTMIVCDAVAQEMPRIEKAVIRRAFQDSRGDLWFGGDGLYRYDGNSLEYFNVQAAWGGAVVRAIAEDRGGNLWLGAKGGLLEYDGETFTNLHEAHGLVNNDVWSMIIDRDGVIWAGTLEGLSRYDGDAFTTIDIPEAPLDRTRGVTSARIVHALMEDSKGRIWIGTNGGAYIYDGELLSNISAKDGLCDNNVNFILEDRDGNIWFATHHGGVCRFDGESFTHVPDESKADLMGWDVYEDAGGGIWFPLDGLHRYDGESYTRWGTEHGIDLAAIHDTLVDRDGHVWITGFTGVYRLEGESFVKITNDGPWPAGSQ